MRMLTEAVEVGVNEGVNANSLLNEWWHGPLHLRLVELDPGKEPLIRQNIRHWDNDFNGGNAWQLYLGDGFEIAKQFADGFFDYVYIDDDHNYEGVCKSIAAWWPKVKQGGFFAGHDWACDTVEWAVREFAHREQLKIQLAEEDWWIVRPY